MVDATALRLGPDPQESTARVPVLDRAPRVALVVFVAVEIGAAILFLVQGRHQWFFNDDWDFLVARSATNPSDLLRAHYEHWTTVPILAYRGLWSLFGIRSYLPYQALSVASHLGVAAMLRVVMRRARVGPWIATLAASVIALFGSGHDNVVWAFQITFTGALLFGLVQLVLADHDGSVDRRDWAGLLAGLVAIMCSGVGLVMVAVVGGAALVRRGWKVALFHTAPLAAIYGLWLIAYGQQSEYSEQRAGARGIAAFVGRGLSATVEALGQVPFVGWLVVAGAIIGLLVACRTLGLDEIRRHRIAPIALLGGAVLFLIVTAVGRAGVYGSARAELSRYLYTVAALIIPAIGMGLDALVRRWSLLAPLVVLALLAGLPGNIAAADDRSPYLWGEKTFILTLPRVANAQAAPDSLRPGGQLAPDLTLGWLKQGVRDGRVPAPAEMLPAFEQRATLAVGLTPVLGPSSSVHCERLTGSVERQLDVGESVSFSGAPLRVRVVGQSGPLNGTVFDPTAANQLVVVSELPPLTFEAADPRFPPTVCG